MPSPPLQFKKSKRLEKRLNSTEHQDHVERLDAGGEVPMKKDQTTGPVRAMEMELVDLKHRMVFLEFELQSMRETTMTAIKKELKAELLKEFPQLGINLLARDENFNQSSIGEPLENIRENDKTNVRISSSTAESAASPLPSQYSGRTMDRWHVRGTLGNELGDEYEFQESVWDLALFIGLPELGLFGSIYITMLLFANVFLQVGMTVIINEVFTEQSIDEDTVTAMRHWRVFFGHSFDFADKITFESLSSRVCKEDSSIPYSEGVLSLVVRISEYMPSSEFYASRKLPFGHLVPFFENIGLMLCMFAILIWLLEIVTQCDKQWQLAIAIKRIPIFKSEGAHAGGCLASGPQDTVTLTSMTAKRKAWAGVLILLQFLVILPLGAMGVVFMIATTDMRELLLNCSALAIVHNTDEMFYAALAPRAGKLLMRALKPLPRGVSQTVHGLNWEAFFFTMCILSVLAYALVPLHDLLQIMRDTRQEVCGGNRNFLYVRDKAGIINAAQVGFLMDDETLDKTYAFEAARQLIVDDFAVANVLGASMSEAASGMTNSIWSLQTRRDLNVEDVMGFWNEVCWDLLLPSSVSPLSPYLLHIVRDSAQNSSIHSCNDFGTSCSGDDLKGLRARQFCPVTCGCANRSSSLALEGIIGCPPSCARSADYNASMWSKSCVDEGISSDYWNRFISGLRGLQASYPTSWGGDFDPSIKTLRDHGCNVVGAKLLLSFLGSLWTDPCITSPANVKSLIYACPISCECHTNFRSGCPLACQAAVGR